MEILILEIKERQSQSNLSLEEKMGHLRGFKRTEVGLLVLCAITIQILIPEIRPQVLALQNDSCIFTEMEVSERRCTEGPEGPGRTPSLGSVLQTHLYFQGERWPQV